MRLYLNGLRSLGVALFSFLTISAAVPPTNNQTPSLDEKQQTVQIALLLDTSNSMDGLIDQAKTQLWDIVNEFTYAKCRNRRAPQLQIALYQYGNDGLSPRVGYVEKILDFSTDLDEISKKLFSLTTNGGKEYCGRVIGTSLDQLAWNDGKDDLKLIFIAGNEAFDQGNTSFENSILKAKEDGVTVNTIFCGNRQLGIETLWQKGALLGDGEYMALDHNRDIVHIATPYDDIIIKLNGQLNNTYIGYGKQYRFKMENQRAQDANAMAAQEVVAVKRAVSKSSSFYNNKSWDLVDAAADEAFDINDMEPGDLPKR